MREENDDAKGDGKGNSNAENNGNSTHSEPFVSVSELAVKLNVSLPRLMRLVRRDEYKEHTEQQERRTKTGTRTVTVVSVSVIPQIESALREGNGTKPEQKHEQYEGEPSEVLASEDTRVRALVGLMMQQAEARIREQEQTIADLRQDKTEWREERKRLQGEVEVLALENAALKAIPASVGETEKPVQEFVHGAVANDSAEPVQVDAPTAPETAREPRPWWRFW